jgi:hypothetical protein
LVNNTERGVQLVEALTRGECVASHLEEPAREVVVADPDFAPMYTTRDKKIKTDNREARTRKK